MKGYTLEEVALIVGGVLWIVKAIYSVRNEIRKVGTTLTADLAEHKKKIDNHEERITALENEE